MTHLIRYIAWKSDWFDKRLKVERGSFESSKRIGDLHKRDSQLSSIRASMFSVVPVAGAVTQSDTPFHLLLLLLSHKIVRICPCSRAILVQKNPS